jgi:hypothetical protein
MNFIVTRAISLPLSPCNEHDHLTVENYDSLQISLYKN